MVSATSSLPRVSERSEKNTSWRMSRAARSSLIIASMAATAASRTSGSQRSSGKLSSERPCSAASACADGLQVVAGIEARRDLADVLAQRLAVAQIGRAGERVDLRAGVVDVVFARHLVAGELQQVGERIAEHGAAAVADVHRAGRVGRDVLDVDPLAAAEIGAAVVGALLQDGRDDAVPEARRKLRLRKPGPGHLDPLDVGIGPELLASLSAMSRGFILAALASTSAALQARSPCAASRGGATSTLAKSSPGGSAPSACSACSAARMRPCTSA